jgi:hypothetical protein
LIDLDPALGGRATSRAEAQAGRRQVRDRTIPPARATIRAAEREAIRQSLSRHLMASRPRSLARTPALARLLAFGAKLSEAAKRLVARRHGRDQDTPTADLITKPATEPVDPSDHGRAEAVRQAVLRAQRSGQVGDRTERDTTEDAPPVVPLRPSRAPVVLPEASPEAPPTLAK